jgi:hypothetical protein
LRDMWERQSQRAGVHIAFHPSNHSAARTGRSHASTSSLSMKRITLAIHLP